MATAPRMTITMAITIAKTGCSMKNRAIVHSPALRPAAGVSSGVRYGCGWSRMPGRMPPRSGVIVRRARRRWVGPLARAHLQLAFDNDAIAGLQTLLDDPGC